ncbi:MAG: monovalent cation/H+ antiporter complex subunit F [Chloroflexota bacterium]|nr:monovalent cation/H+ antiporter complex subunit F [Chloroflexota bacterium]
MTGIAAVALLVVVICIIPCVYRIAVGPHALDRLLAFDLAGVLLSLAVAVYAIIQGSWAYLEISMGLAVLAFVGTIAVAQYIEREGLR